MPLNAVPVRSSEQSNVSAHYSGPFVDKNKRPQGELLYAMEHMKKYPIIA